MKNTDEMNEAESACFDRCLEQARALVAACRAKAPEGCDPCNTIGLTFGVVGLVTGVAGSIMSYHSAQEAADQQDQLSLLNAQAQTQAVTQQGRLAAMQAQINQQLALNDRRAANAAAAGLEQQAEIARKINQSNEDKAREDFRRIMAAQRVGAAAGGVLDTTGSPYELLLDTAAKEQQKIDQMNYDGEVQRRQMLAQAQDYRNQGLMAEINGLSQQSKGAAAIGGIQQGVAQAKLNLWGARAQADAMRNQATGQLIGGISSTLAKGPGQW